jgi:hypothetical protein
MLQVQPRGCLKNHPIADQTPGQNKAIGQKLPAGLYTLMVVFDSKTLSKGAIAFDPQ